MTQGPYTRLFLGLAGMLFLPLATVSAQHSQGWQGSRLQQLTNPSSATQASHLTPAPQESAPTPLLQPVFPRHGQPSAEGHPQVIEMPAPQAPDPLASQPNLTSPQPPPSQRLVHRPAQPPYLGLAGKTASACRYPAGIRVTQVIEDSPAHKAGIKGATTVTWKQAMIGFLTLSPAAFLVAPFIDTDDEHQHGGGMGDLILAVDGKRIRTTEEFAHEMKRFQPGDVVYFSVLREGSGLYQIATHLSAPPESEHTVPAARQQARMTPSASGL